MFSYLPQMIFRTFKIQLLLWAIYNIPRPMKKVISALGLLTLGLAGKFNISVGSRLTPANQNVYDLSCQGAQGTVRYFVEGLPTGVRLEGSTIYIESGVQTGTYSLRIRAVDELSQTAQRVINLSIVQEQGSFNGNSSQQNIGNSAQNSIGQNSNSQSTSTSINIGQSGLNLGSLGQASSTQTITQTTTQNISQSSNGNNLRLDNILNQFPDAKPPKLDYGNSGRYPEPKFPTGPDPNLVNPSLIGIESSQAPRTEANRNTITVDDVTLRAASQRHQNAIKGITNLLKIIDQARANREKAQRDIQTFTQSYNQAVTGQRNAQNDILTSETKISQIVSAMNSLTSTIEDLRNRINQAAARSEALNREKSTIVVTITSQESDKASLLEKLNGVNQELGQRTKELSDKNAECQTLSNSVVNKQKEVSDLRFELTNGETIRPRLANDIDTKARTVDDLRRQLLQAEKALADAKIKLADFDARRLTLPVLISNLQKELDSLQLRAKACADEVARLQALIDGLKTRDTSKLTGDIKNIDDKITVSRTRVSEIDAAIAAAQGPVEDLKSKLAKANEDLSFLKVQKNDSDSALRLSYQRGNDSNNRVAVAKQNLDAVIKRFQDESKIVSDATLNLERARAEEALARTGLEEIIAHYSDALPYAIVPNGNGSTQPGTPSGNNRSGSPLGPVNVSVNGAQGSFRITSWTNYLSSAFGAGVQPAYPGSVTQLFPFSFQSVIGGNIGFNTLVQNGISASQTGTGCNSSSTPRVTVGKVVGVKDGCFQLRGDDGLTYTINVAPCTALNANQPNYSIKIGHEAVVKGVIANVNQPLVLTGTQVTCLA